MKAGREDDPVPQGRRVLRYVFRSGQVCGRHLNGIGRLALDDELPCYLAQGHKVTLRRNALAAEPDDAGNLLVLFQKISHVQRGARELAPWNLDFLPQLNGADPGPYGVLNTAGGPFDGPCEIIAPDYKQITASIYEPHCIIRSMADLATTLPALLKAWEDGTIRVGSSRVLLDLVVHHFKQGATAEQIQHSFPSLTLREVYGAIYYYLEHTEDVETYLADRESQAEEIERVVRSTQDTPSLQKRLEERRARLFR